MDQFIENHSSLVILSGKYTAYAYSGGEYAAISEIPENAVQAQNITDLDVEEVSSDVIAPIFLNAEMPYATLPPGYPSYSLMDIQIYTQKKVASTAGLVVLYQLDIMRQVLIVGLQKI